MIDTSNYGLLPHNTFGIDVRCRRFVEYATEDEARQVAAILRDEPCALVIGAGSNLLLTGDYDGVVVHSAVRGVSFDPSSLLLTCGSGEVMDDIVTWTVDNGFYDLVNLSLIPGEVGASVVQNVGAYGVEVGQYVDEIVAVEIATGQTVRISAADCHYAYRYSRFKDEWRGRYLVVQVTYRLHRGSQPRLDYGNIRSELERRGIVSPTPEQLRQVIIDIRRAKLPDPAVTGNAGSFFVNPVVGRACYEFLAAQYPDMPHYTIDAEHEKIPAGWLIEQCGWKGRTLGRAGVHDRQALVLVNRGGATGADVVALCEAIRRDVRQRFGIDIRPEVNIV